MMQRNNDTQKILITVFYDTHNIMLPRKNKGKSGKIIISHQTYVVHEINARKFTGEYVHTYSTLSRQQ